MHGAYFKLVLRQGQPGLPGAIEELGWPLDRIVHAEVWATDTIPADLPPMVEFKARADAIIKERWGIEVEYVRSNLTAEKIIHQKRKRGNRPGQIIGWPLTTGGKYGCELKKPLKNNPITKILDKNDVVYLGIACDEPERFKILSDKKISPLKEAKWTERKCFEWCEKNNLLSPIYTETTRGGCWFCPNQRVNQLWLLRRDYPNYWALMLEWDRDSPTHFHPDGKTVHSFELRFQMEDLGIILTDRKFRWDVLDQINIFDCMRCNT